jgi:pyridoxal phosphate enzyme (YggS family)
MLNVPVDVAANLAALHEAIADAAVRAGRSADEVTLVGVSKTHSAEEVVRAVQAGLRHVGENRVQEAAPKLAEVRQSIADGAVFHMIGHLQTNKAGAGVEVFDRIDSVDSVKLAQALSRHVAPGRELPVLVEVYVGDDPSRPGVRPDHLVEVVGGILDVPRLRVEGLMTVAPLGGDARAAFARVRDLKQILSASFPAVHFGVLSMGMSEDYREAIAEGSTEVRLGTALFGPRNQR